MSLLDDVSIVVTPNGYKAGELYAVIPVPTEGADLINDGDFPLPNTEWTIGGGAEITVDGARINNTVTGVNAYIKQVLSGIVSGKQFVLTYDVITTNGTTLAIEQNSSISLNTSTIGTNREVIFTWDRYNNDVIIKRLTTGTDVTIDNVILQELTSADMDVTRATAATRVDENGLVNYAEVVGGEEVTNGDFATDTDWTKGTGWTISGDKAIYTGTANASLNQSNALISGKFYKLQYEVISSSLDGVFKISGVTDSAQSPLSQSVGTHTVYFTADGSAPTNIALRVVFNTTGTLEIDNVSVKEVIRDNVPRIDYTGGGCPHILAEPMRTNLVTYSEDFSDSSWIKSGVTLTAGQISPSGDTSAYKLDFSANNDYIQTAISGLDTSKEYTLSFYAKVQSGTTTIDAGNINGGSYETLTITNEWQRFEVTQTPSGTTRYPRPIRSNGSDEIYLWGAQLEQGSYATSYIPNSGTALGVTRNQDIFTRDGIGSLINSTEGVLFVEAQAFSNTDAVRIAISDGTNNNNIYIELTTSSVSAVGRLIAVNQFSLFSSQTTTNYNKIAVKFKENDFALWINGVEVATYSSGSTYSIGTLNTLSFDRGDGGIDFYGKVKQLQVYKTALTDDQLEDLTS
jgi:hypothetical protein